MCNSLLPLTRVCLSGLSATESIDPKCQPKVYESPPILHGLYSFKISFTLGSDLSRSKKYAAFSTCSDSSSKARITKSKPASPYLSASETAAIFCSIAPLAQRLFTPSIPPQTAALVGIGASPPRTASYSLGSLGFGVIALLPVDYTNFD